MKRGFKFLIFALFFGFLLTGWLGCKQESPDDPVRTVKVILDSGEGSWIFQPGKEKVVEVPYGEALREYLPKWPPYLKYHEYQGMFEDKEGKIIYRPDQPVYTPVHLYAQYEKIAESHEVTFIMEGEDMGPPVTVAPGDRATVPELSRDCPVVWYYDSKFTTRFDIDSEIENDYTLYGVWADYSGSWKGFISFLTEQDDAWFNDESVTRGFIIQDDTATAISGLASLSREVEELELFFYPVTKDELSDDEIEEEISPSLPVSIRWERRKVRDMEHAIQEKKTGKKIQQALSILSKAKWQKLYFNFRETKLLEISESSFSGCTSLYKIYLPSSVTTIGKEAFMDCSNLYEFYIPEKVNSIGEAAFKNCSSIANEITILDGVTEIAAQSFRNCKSIPKINLPGSVYRIYELAFYGCEGLKEVIVQEGVRFIRNGAFACLGKLDREELPSTLKTKLSDNPDELTEYGAAPYTFWNSSCSKKIYNGDGTKYKFEYENNLQIDLFDVIIKNNEFDCDGYSIEWNLMFDKWDYGKVGL